jgi:hypothetical protein
VVAEALRAVGLAVAPRGWRWYVFGAQAVLVHGAPRLTADVDVTIDTGASSSRDAIEALGLQAIVPRATGFDELLANARLLPMVHAPSGIPVDVVLAAGGIEKDFLDRAIVVDLGGVAVPVLSAEDLVATKVVAGRRKDREDVVGILQAQGDRLDLERLRRTLADLDATLDEPRAVARFERIFTSYRKKLRP